MVDVLVAALVSSVGFVSLLSLTAHVLELNQLAVAALHADAILLDFRAHMLSAYRTAQDLPFTGELCSGGQPPWVVNWCAAGALDDFGRRFVDLGFTQAVLCGGPVENMAEYMNEGVNAGGAVAIDASHYELSLLVNGGQCQSGEPPLVREVVNLGATP
jgi:hypothetical protein